ncbi:MAG: hypothetical protein V1827_01120 [Candidatus Micrarchaeota archaeon]
MKRQRKEEHLQRADMAGRFGRYSKESGQDVRTAGQTSSPVMDAFRKAWNALKFSVDTYGVENLVRYSKMLKSLSVFNGLLFGPKDVAAFSLAMKEFEDDPNFSSKAGSFLSVLIRLGPKGKYTIYTNHLDKKINWLGRHNRKGRTIIVQGDVGDGIGDKMSGGKIIIHGNAGSAAGTNLLGGTIIIKGDCGDLVGLASLGGVIRIEGDYEGEIIAVEGGESCRVFHKGKLISGGDSG